LKNFLKIGLKTGVKFSIVNVGVLQKANGKALKPNVPFSPKNAQKS